MRRVADVLRRGRRALARAQEGFAGRSAPGAAKEAAFDATAKEDGLRRKLGQLERREQAIRELAASSASVDEDGIRRKLEHLERREQAIRKRLELIEKRRSRAGSRRQAPAAASSGTTHDASGDGFVVDPDSRADFYLAAAAFTTVVGVESEDGAFLVPTRDMGSIGRNLFVTGGYAGRALPRLHDAVREAGANVRPGGTIFDIGANIGTVVIPAVLRHGYDRGVAFEAHPTNAHFLRLNVAHSRVDDRVDVVEVALGDHDEVGAMAAAGVSGRHRVLHDVPERKQATGQTVPIPIARLDTLIERGDVDASSLSLLWMDVQGYEAAVLRGARSILADPPLVVTEFSPRHLAAYGDLDAMIDLIAEHFTHVLDLKETFRRGKLSLHPADRGRELVERLEGRFTDLALLRMSGGR